MRRFRPLAEFSPEDYPPTSRPSAGEGEAPTHGHSPGLSSADADADADDDLLTRSSSSAAAGASPPPAKRARTSSASDYAMVRTSAFLAHVGMSALLPTLIAHNVMLEDLQAAYAARRATRMLLDMSIRARHAAAVVAALNPLAAVAPDDAAAAAAAAPTALAFVDGRDADVRALREPLQVAGFAVAVATGAAPRQLFEPLFSTDDAPLSAKVVVAFLRCRDAAHAERALAVLAAATAQQPPAAVVAAVHVESGELDEANAAALATCGAAAVIALAGECHDSDSSASPLACALADELRSLADDEAKVAEAKDDEANDDEVKEAGDHVEAGDRVASAPLSVAALVARVQARCGGHCRVSVSEDGHIAL